MTKDTTKNKVTVDGVEYKLDEISENAKAQLNNIHFVDSQIQQLNNEWAIADTARIGYSNALKIEIKKMEGSE